MSHKQDLAFFGLLISVVIHFLLGVWFAYSPPPNLSLPEKPTEVTFIERDKGRRIVTVPNTTEDEDVYDKLKKQADYLAQFTQRVKQQMVAREAEKTKNLDRFKPQANRAGGTQQPRGETERGDVSRENQGARGAPLQSSTLNQFIPGVQEGFFTILNADQFTYFAFFNRMNEQVRNRWTSRVRAFVGTLDQAELMRLSIRNQTTRGELILSKTGEFISAKITDRSDADELDQATIESFKAAAPFLNPPVELVENGVIRLPYVFTLYFRPTFGPGSQ